MSGSVQQSGLVVSGRAATWYANGIIVDAGPASGGNLSEIGITNNGQTAIGVNSGPVTGPYIQFSVAVSSTGTITIGANSFNGAPSADLIFNINGVNYQFNPAGNGNIAGAGPVTSGDLLKYNGTSGFLVQDSGILASNVLQGPVLEVSGADCTNTGTFINGTMSTPYVISINGANPQTLYNISHPNLSASVGFNTSVIVPATSNQYESAGISSYILNQSAGEVTGGSFFAYNTVAGSFAYALNPLVDDGGVASNVIGMEIDIGAKNVNTQALGINTIGVFPNGTPPDSIAYLISEISGYGWATGIFSGNGCAVIFAVIGAVSSLPNSDSQPIQFNCIDSAGTTQIAGIQSSPVLGGASLDLNPTGPGIVNINKGLYVVGNAAVSGTLNCSDGITVGIPTTGPLVTFFANGTTEVGSITSSGAGIEINPYGDVLGVGGSFYVSGTAAVAGTLNAGNGIAIAIPSTGAFAGFYANNTSLVGSITTNGSTTAYNTTSDRRLKNVYGKSNGSLIDCITVYKGSFKAQPDEVRSFVIADELENVSPCSVTGTAGAVGPNGEIVPQFVDYTSLIPDLIAKCQTLQAQNDKLSERLATIEARYA